MSSLRHATTALRPGSVAVRLPALSSAAMFLQQLTFLSHVELHEGCFIVEVIGDIPEPEAHTFFHGYMRNKRETSDVEWASIFEVRHRLLSPVIWFGANVVGAGVSCCHAGVRGQCWLSAHHCPVDQKRG